MPRRRINWIRVFLIAIPVAVIAVLLAPVRPGPVSAVQGPGSVDPSSLPDGPMRAPVPRARNRAAGGRGCGGRGLADDDGWSAWW